MFNPAPLMQLATDIGWLERAENCLIFGPSGVGKTHLSVALARAIIELGKRASFLQPLSFSSCNRLSESYCCPQR